MLRRNGLRTGQYMHAGRWGDAATVNRDAVYAAPRPGKPSDAVYPLHNRYAAA